MSAAKVSQSVKTVTLAKNDMRDRQSVMLSLADGSLTGIRRVTLTDPSGNLKLTPLGNGEYAIGYRDNLSPAKIAKLKTANVKLNVFLMGNGGAKANASLSVKVNFV